MHWTYQLGDIRRLVMMEMKHMGNILKVLSKGLETCKM